jgi:hypothetical protein
MLGDQRVTGHHSKEVDGEAIERWVLKALIGLVASGNAAKDDQPVKKSNPPLAWLQLLYGLEPMPAGWGLYLTSGLREAPMRTRSVAFAPLIESDKMVGALCRINGFEFVLAMATPEKDRPGSLLTNAIFRPAHLLFSHISRDCSVRLRFRWATGGGSDGLDVAFHAEDTGPHNTPLQPTSGAGTAG